MSKPILRMCVACRQHKPAIEMTRVVRLGNSAEVDPAQTKNGRGAYVCKMSACVAKSKKGKLLNRALSIKVDDDVYEALPVDSDI